MLSLRRSPCRWARCVAYIQSWSSCILFDVDFVSYVEMMSVVSPVDGVESMKEGV